MKLLAIADDFTGAAEIAGIGWRFGLATRLTRDGPLSCGEGLTVIDSDSRLLTPGDAAARVTRFVEGLNAAEIQLIYKKTDSVMRGPLAAEISALAMALRKRRTLLLPQNPSRGRTIEAGVYRIGGIPLDQTPFANDPEYPAKTADVIALLASTGVQARCLRLADSLPNDGMHCCEAESADDVYGWAVRVTENDLPAGGADFFEANLRRLRLGPRRASPPHAPAGGIVLFISGSAAVSGSDTLRRARETAVPICLMPETVFDPARSDSQAVHDWANHIGQTLRKSRRAMVTVGRAVNLTPGISSHLLSALALTAQKVLSHIPDLEHLLMDGGATASAVCKAMHWKQFEIIAEIAPGAVSMRALHVEHAPVVTVKPGSYPWPDSVWARSA